MSSDSLSNPCPVRCPTCGGKCFGRVGHAEIKTAGKGYAQPHQCLKHFWGTMAEWTQIARAEARETRHEVVEAIRGCGRCLVKVRRLGV